MGVGEDGGIHKGKVLWGRLCLKVTTSKQAGSRNKKYGAAELHRPDEFRKGPLQKKEGAYVDVSTASTCYSK